MNEYRGYLEHLEREDRSPLTIANYRVHLSLFAQWFEQTSGQTFVPARVTPLDVREYRRDLLNRKKAPGTINYKLNILKGYFKWAVDQGMVNANPAQQIKLEKEAKQAPKWLDRQQVYALLRAAAEAVQLAELKGSAYTIFVTKRNVAAIALMLQAGLRLREVIYLMWDDITILRRSGKVKVRGKGRKHRTVPLNTDARHALEAYRQIATGRKYVFGSNERDQPLHTRTLQCALVKLAYAGRLEGFTCHQLRHTFCKNLVDVGVSLDQVAALAGHVNIQTTMLYTLPSEQDLEAAVERIAWSD